MFIETAEQKLEKIKTRKGEIRKLLKDDKQTPVDLEAIEQELSELDAAEARANKELQVLGASPSVRFGPNGPEYIGSVQGSSILRSVGLGDDLHASVRSASDANLAAVVRGMATGDWNHVSAEQRALISSGAAAAIPGASVLAIVEQAMQKSVVFRAGARVVNIDRPSEKVARVISTGTPEWAPDDADRDLTDQTISIQPEDLTAHSAWLFTECSIESLEDATGLEDAITSAFAKQLGLLYDQAAIAGTGVDMPKGIGVMTTATDGINEIATVGDLVDHKPFVRAAGSVLGMNHRPSSVMVDTDMWTELAMLTDTTDQPIQPPKAYTDLGEYVTNFLPDGNAIVADWSKWLFGTRTNITLEVSRTGEGFKKGFVQIRAYVRFGGIPVDPSAFCRLSGITLPDAPSA